jgi:hypothetical protein
MESIGIGSCRGREVRRLGVAAAAAEPVLPCIRYHPANIQWWESLLHEVGSIRAEWSANILHRHQIPVLGWCSGALLAVFVRGSVAVMGLGSRGFGESSGKTRCPCLLMETADAKSLAGMAAIKPAAGVLQGPQEVWGPQSKRTKGPDSWVHKCLPRTWLGLSQECQPETNRQRLKKIGNHNRITNNADL